MKSAKRDFMGSLAPVALIGISIAYDQQWASNIAIALVWFWALLSAFAVVLLFGDDIANTKALTPESVAQYRARRNSVLHKAGVAIMWATALVLAGLGWWSTMAAQGITCVSCAFLRSLLDRRIEQRELPT